MKTTVNVRVRHSVGCPDKNEGPFWQKCNCWKSLLIYGNGRQFWKKADTKNWRAAELQAAEYLKSIDPIQIELNTLRAVKDLETLRIEDAIVRYYADLTVRRRAPGTMRMYRQLLGNIDPVTKAVLKNGRLFDFIHKQVPRPVTMMDLTVPFLTAWRASWTNVNDFTTQTMWLYVSGFFTFCTAQGWVRENPHKKIPKITIAPGCRTTVFTDKQYNSLLAATKQYAPENISPLTKATWQPRLVAFMQLLRWSGMDLIDGVKFAPEWLDAQDVLRYKRTKTRRAATILLPKPIAKMLRNVPLDSLSVGVHQPFRRRDIQVESDIATWQRRLHVLFGLAGITEVKTELRTRRPHPKMLRDTFAVWNLRQGVPVYNVSKMLGHASVKTTERAYLPWVKEMEDAHIAVMRKHV